MSDTPGSDEAHSAAERLEAALARIAAGLAKSAAMPDKGADASPDTAALAARIDGLIERVRAELEATHGNTGP